MALTPEQLTELQRLRQMFAPLAEQERRRQQATANAEAMANKKAKGGSAKDKALKAFMKGTKAKERLYHGTGNLEALTAFDPASTGKGVDQLGSGFYLSNDPEEASGYAGNFHSHTGEKNPSPGVIPAHVAIRNPIKLGKKANSLSDARVNLTHAQIKQIMEHVPNLRHPELSPLYNHVDTSRGVTPHMINDIAKLYTGNALHAMENDLFYDNPTAYRTALNKVLGYDGVVKDFGNGRKHYVAWFPNQIKSAIGNRGSYDPNNPDLTMAQGGNVSKNPFDYQNKKHVHEAAKHLVKHGKFPLPKGIGATGIMRDILSSGKFQTLEDPRVQEALQSAGHDSYYTQEKTGKQINPMGMAKGGEAKAKKPTVEEMKRQIFEAAQANLQRPSEVLGQHEGKYLHLTEADRAAVENRKHGLRGGVGFSQIGLDNPEYAGRVWGVGKPGVVSKLLNKEKRGLPADAKSVWSTFIGAPEMHTSNQLVFNRMWNKFQEARKAGKLSPEQEQMMLNMMRQAMTKEGKNIFDPDVSFDNSHHLFDTFERRRVLSDLMAGKQIGGKKGQIFDASKVIEDTTDPKLLHAPTFSVGPHAFEFSGETSHEPHLNKAFPYMLHGTTSKHAFKQMPFEMAVPEYMAMVQQLKGRKPGYMDIVRNIPRQHISEKYLTGLQKAGYADGGNVDQSDVNIAEVGVNEAPNLPVKAYSPFATDESQGMPFGGVDMDNSQPGQQLMSQQQMQQVQQPAPQSPTPPAAPAPQGGSNILQMTPQGRAMSAMQPPQPVGKKRGGKVTMPSTDGMRYALTVKSKKAK